MADEHESAGADHIKAEASERSAEHATGTTLAGLARGDLLSRSQAGVTSETTPAASELPFQISSQHPQPYGHGTETAASTIDYPTAFNVDQMASALPQQSTNTGRYQWVTSPAQRRNLIGGIPQQRSSDPTFIPHQQHRFYYPTHGSSHSAQQMYMSQHYVQHHAQYMPIPASNPQILVPQQDPYRFSPAQQLHSHGQTYHPYGQGQNFAYDAMGVPNQPGMEQFAYNVGSSVTNSTSNHASDFSSPVQPLSPSSARSVPRGPPRKPRQSGHALWVGNLPPGITVVDLKDHFAREATADIESVKLISKSNCAFVNYRSHLACASAMERFHDSRFHGTKLVCRLRRTTAASSVADPIDASTKSTPTTENAEDKRLEDVTGHKALPVAVDRPPPSVEGLPERFFVLKSLTLEDLEVCTHTGVWATQSHNEEVLNRAYSTSENVYLFFSANKSGEYFGFAQMASRIGEIIVPSKLGVPSLPSPSSPGGMSVDEPLTSIRTGSTEWAPKGRIIDDTARGTIFWEADSSDEDDGARRNLKSKKEDEERDSKGEETKTTGESNLPTSQMRPEALRLEPAIASSTPITSPTEYSSSNAEFSASDRSHGSSPGKSFQVTWISIKKLPFYKCRGLRNPWNANREIKIARDGTELETSVGKKLMSFFPPPGYPGA